MGPNNDNYRQFLGMRAAEMAAYQAVLAAQPKSTLEKAKGFVLSIFTVVVSNTLYKSRPVIFDTSDYQARQDGSTGVDWDGLSQYPEFAGAYVKGGEVGDDAWTGNLSVFKWWKESSLDSNLEGLARNKKWAGVYFFLNTARWLGGDLRDYTKLDDGDVVTRIANYLYKDPEIHLILYALKIGLAAIFPDDPLQVKNKVNKRYHAIILDVERWWKYYPIPKSPTEKDIVSEIWIGEIAGRTASRLQFLMDQGYLPQVPILFYSGEWFLSRYMPTQRTKLDFYDTVCAHYYWGGSTVLTTFREIVDTYLPQIPDAWRPRLFGRSGKIFQISGDKFRIPEILNNMGLWSPLDLNVFWGSLAEMKKYFPRWNDAAEPAPVDPAPTPEPAPVKKKKVATIVVDSLRVRTSPDTSIATNIVKSVKRGELVDVTDVITDANGNTWAVTSIPAYIAVKWNGTTFSKVEEVPV